MRFFLLKYQENVKELSKKAINICNKKVGLYWHLHKNGYNKIELLDLYAEQFFPCPTTNQGDEYTVDGLHPNAECHARLADRIAKYLK